MIKTDIIIKNKGEKMKLTEFFDEMKIWIGLSSTFRMIAMVILTQILAWDLLLAIVIRSGDLEFGLGVWGKTGLIVATLMLWISYYVDKVWDKI